MMLNPNTSNTHHPPPKFQVHKTFTNVHPTFPIKTKSFPNILFGFLSNRFTFQWPSPWLSGNPKKKLRSPNTTSLFESCGTSGAKIKVSCTTASGVWASWLKIWCFCLACALNFGPSSHNHGSVKMGGLQYSSIVVTFRSRRFSLNHDYGRKKKGVYHTVFCD